MARLSILTFLTLVLQWQIAVGQGLIQCKWTDPDTNASFNLQPMYRQSAMGDYVGADNIYRYYMNICGAANVGGNCTDQAGLLCQYKQGQYQALIASFIANPKPVWSLISRNNPNAGLILNYSNGDICYETNQSRVATLFLHCDTQAPVTTTFTLVEPDQCTYQISLTSPNACPITDQTLRILSGENITANLPAGNWSYWTIDVQDGQSELQVNLEQTSTTGGYQNLFVRLGARPTESAYDAADISLLGKHKVVLRRPGYSPNLQSPATYYIGVKSYNQNTAYALTAYTNLCFSNCSGHGTCAPNATTGWSTCQCAVGYQTPFPDCSAPLIDVARDQQYHYVLEDDNTAYFRYQLNDSNAYQLFVEIVRDMTDPMETLPIMMINTNDFPTVQDNDGYIADRAPGSNFWQLEIMEGIQQGDYILAVVGSLDTTFKFSVEFNVYDCDHNCSGQGTCNPVTHVCTCADGYGDLDCGEYTRPLSFGSPLQAYVAPNQISYFVVNISSAETLSEIDLLFEVIENDPNYYPRIYGSPAIMGVPTITNHLYASPLPLSSLESIRVPAYVLNEYGPGTWYFGISSFSPVAFEVTIQASLEGYCPDDCSGNGKCYVDPNTFRSTCQCDSGWVGGACDTLNSDITSDNVDTGLFVGLIFVFLFIGFLVGLGSSFLIKKCKEGKQTSYATTTSSGGGYNAVNE